MSTQAEVASDALQDLDFEPQCSLGQAVYHNGAKVSESLVRCERKATWHARCPNGHECLVCDHHRKAPYIGCKHDQKLYTNHEWDWNTL